MTEKMYDELKTAAFNIGAEAINDLLGFDCNYDDKDTIDNLMDEIFTQMPEENALELYNKYCKKNSIK